MKKLTIKLICSVLLALGLLTTSLGCQESGSLTVETAPPQAETPIPLQTPTPLPSNSPDQSQTAVSPSQTTQVEQVFFKQEVNVPYYFDLNEDGDKEEILVNMEDDGLGNPIIWLSVTDGDNVQKVEVGQNHPEVYYCENPNGKLGVIISFDPLSDDYVTQAYTFDDTTPIETNFVFGDVTSIENGQVNMFTYVYAFGTWSATGAYTLSDDFYLEPSGSKLWNIELGEYDIPLTAIQPVPVQILRDGAYRYDELPVGTQIWPTATDGKSIFLFETEDGEEGKIEFTFDSFSYINGIIDTDYFDGIRYSG